MLPKNSIKNKIGRSIVVTFFIGTIFCLFTTDAFCEQNPVITFYQNHISAVDGDRCPMYPTCSAYAANAMEKHGVIIGWVMALDRLVRCGRDEATISNNYIIDGQTRVYDPVEANDFWWFNKEKIK